MDISGEYFIPMPREAVWRALNDRAVLEAAIPGCEALTRIDEQTLSATVKVKVGVVRVRLQGQVVLSNIVEAESYTITGGGKGATGFAQGSARVTLKDAEGGTSLSYLVDASLGGKLAQLGARLMQSTAKKLANDFFVSLIEAASGAEPGIGCGPEKKALPPDALKGAIDISSQGLSPWIWGPGVAVLLLASLLLFAGR